MSGGNTGDKGLIIHGEAGGITCIEELKFLCSWIRLWPWPWLKLLWFWPYQSPMPPNWMLNSICWICSLAYAFFWAAKPFCLRVRLRQNIRLNIFSSSYLVWLFSCLSFDQLVSAMFPQQGQKYIQTDGFSLRCSLFHTCLIDFSTLTAHQWTGIIVRITFFVTVQTWTSVEKKTSTPQILPVYSTRWTITIYIQ